jgi:predicted nucleic acid-binding protein
LIERYVVDASVALKWFLSEPGSDRARALYNSLLAGQVILIAPDILVAEFGNALWKRVTLYLQLPLTEAQEFCSTLTNSPVELVSSKSLANAALQLAAQLGHPFYDCLYLALAVEQKCEFITADEKLATKLAGRFGLLRKLSSI